MLTSTESPLSRLSRAWERKTKTARDQKYEAFGRFADECMAFYEGTKEAWERYIGGAKADDTSMGVNYRGFKFVSAKGSELVQLFGPVLYDRNPVRTVTTRNLPELRRNAYVDPALERQFQQLQQQVPRPQPGMPPQPPPPALQQQLQMVQQQLQQMEQDFQQRVRRREARDLRATLRSDLLGNLLNYTPNEMDLKTESRQMIDETLIKGMGCLWTEAVERSENSDQFIITSLYDSVDNLLVDPDASDWNEVRWIARRCRGWIYDVADEYGEDVEELRKHCKNYSTESEDGTHDASKPVGGEEDKPDIITYWKIWSRMGLGQTLTNLDEEDRGLFEEMGDYVYLVVVPGMDYPLNLKNTDLDILRQMRDTPPAEEQVEQYQQMSDRIFQQVQWPIPFHLDAALKHKWPVTPLTFHDIPNQFWPMAHLRTGLPDLRFLCQVKSRLATRAHHSSRMFFGVASDLDETTLSEISGDKPVTTIKINRSGNEKVGDMIQSLTLPNGGSNELMAVASQAETDFEKATGLTELMYGQLGGMRSAEEARLKGAAKNVRPDDMARRTEECMTLVARKEALAWIWLGNADDVRPIIGDDGAELWTDLFENQDPLEAAAELDVRIESGSMRKPNQETQQAQMNETMQVMGPVLSQLALVGNPGPWNAMMRQFAKVQQISWVEELLLPPPPPPQPDPRIAAEQQKQQGELAMKSQEHQMKMQAMNFEFQAKQAETNLRLEESKAKLAMAQMKIQVEQAKAGSDMRHKEMQFRQESLQESERARQQLEIERVKAEAKAKEKEKSDAK